jgi:neutral amino acid transport system ATP-binding protein
LTRLIDPSSSSLEVKEVSKSFEGLAVLNKVSLSVPQGGSIVGIIGPNGAGKTTLFNIILGLVIQDEGTVRLNGTSLDGLPSWRRAQCGLGCLWQDSRVFRNLTVLENLLVAANDRDDWGAIHFLLRRGWLKSLETSRKDRAAEVLQKVGLQGREQSLARDLSYGQQRLLSLGRLMVNDPLVLLLDEPTGGLDPAIVDAVLKLIHELRAEGKSILLIEHHPSAVMSTASVVYLMRAGRVAFSAPADIANWGLGSPEERRIGR